MGRPDAVLAPVVELRAITKRFYGVKANDEVDFAVNQGEVHGLLGENGAGKSTLCSIMAGLYQPDSGRVLVHGKPMELSSPAKALEAGIGMVYQHFRLVDELTVAENLVLGHPDVPNKVTKDWLVATAEQVAETFGLEIDPLAVVADLSVGEQQRVEILRLLHRGVELLILDEPTAVLTPQETEALFASIRELVGQGHSVIVVTHKLGEVIAIADTITVMRGGAVVGEAAAADASPQSLSEMMVGSVVDEAVSAGTRAVGEPVLEVHDLAVQGVSDGVPALDGVTLEVGSGEILGVCGVSGNGQTELAEAIVGLASVSSGSVLLNGSDITGRDIRSRIDLGLAYVPADRLSTGLAKGLSVVENLMLKSYWTPAMNRGPFIDYPRARRYAAELIEDFDVRGIVPNVAASALSGGNIQRAILAREISSSPKLIVAASPTRGLDVRATQAVRELLMRQSEGGVGVLLISEDLDEILSITDRIVVIYRGKLVGSFPTAEAEVSRLGELMAGIGVGEAA